MYGDSFWHAFIRTFRLSSHLKVMSGGSLYSSFLIYFWYMCIVFCLTAACHIMLSRFMNPVRLLGSSLNGVRSKSTAVAASASIGSKSQAVFDREDRYGAHNYHPLPVALSKGKGTRSDFWALHKCVFIHMHGHVCTKQSCISLVLTAKWGPGCSHIWCLLEICWPSSNMTYFICDRAFK